MAITFVDDTGGISATSVTSLTLALPTGVADGDMLVALFGIINQTSAITDPASLAAALLATQDAGANTRTRGYARRASAEGTSYQWTLSSAIKNAGWIGAYRGVDAVTPLADWASASSPSGTAHATPAVDVPAGGWLISGVISRHAPGAAGVTTWSTSAGGDVQRYTAASNAGTSDVTIAVFDSAAALSAGSYTRTLTASQTEGQVAVWAFALAAAGGAPTPPAVGGTATGWGVRA